MAEEKINPNHVYISYNGDSREIERKLCALLREAGIECCPYEDMRGQIGSINGFEKKIGRGRIIVILYSKGYFESSHCMNEYAHIRENEDTEQYVRLINCDNVKFTEEFKKELDGYWWAEKGKNRRTDPKTLKEEKLADWNHHYYMDDNDKYSITYLEKYFRDNPNYKNIYGSSDDELKDLVSDIRKYIDTHLVQTSYEALPELKFYTRDESRIVARDKEADLINEYFKKETIVNMVGCGGCGKTTISEYFVNKYRSNFNQITGITINEDLYEDIDNKYTKVLNIPYEYLNDHIVNIFGLGGNGKISLAELLIKNHSEHVKDNEEFAMYRQKRKLDFVATYSKIIAKLNEYPILGDKYNLLILDVNETVGVNGYVRITEALKQIDDRENRLLSNWKILVIAREKLVDWSRVVNLVEADKVSFDVLKAIFFKYLEPIWHDSYKEPKFREDDLKDLFKRLDNCALLVEQLARFLNGDAAMEYQEIIDYLEIEGNITLQSYMSRRDIVSLTDQEKRNEKVGFFLSRLISYADLDGNKDCDIQKKIVRLFAVWERVYHSADEVIYFLVDKSRTDQHVVKEEQEYISKCLGWLVDKRILVPQVEDGKVKKYQIHGMIAATCREQIFANPKFCDFTDYLAKIDAYSGKEGDIIMEKCIIYSLANYVSFDDEYLLKKARIYWNQSIYERALKIRLLKIKQPNISDQDIYYALESKFFKGRLIDEIYYEWLDNESGYLNDIKEYQPRGNHYIDELVANMVLVESGSFERIILQQEYGWVRRLFMKWLGLKPKIVSSKVTLNNYYIGKTQVTQGLWEAVLGKKNNPCIFKKGDNYPVENITWYDCLNFIMELNVLTKLKFRFPTEAQWEYAARGGNKSKGFKYSGSNNLADVAWYIYSVIDAMKCNITSMPVAKKKPNELGIYDMSGNVCEWCQDWYDAYPSENVDNPSGPSSGSSRVLRGGSWHGFADFCRVSYRSNGYPVNRGYDYGLRLALPCLPFPS